jgi:hypothetical protein
VIAEVRGRLSDLQRQMKGSWSFEAFFGVPALPAP